MPEKKTIERARRAKREGKHGARSTKQAIAIGLSKARRSGVPLKPPRKGRASASTRRKAVRDLATARRRRGSASSRRARATERALEREPRRAASRTALSRQAKSAARKRAKAA